MLRNVLSTKESLFLAEMVRDNYKASGLTNAEFAASVNAAAPPNTFRGAITQSHIKNMIDALDIPPNFARLLSSRHADAGQIRNVLDRLQALEDQVAALARLV